MSGVYIHIPFCKTKCPYCDFYSITNWDTTLKEAFLQSIIKEIELRKNFFTGPIETIYFGGGTPSLLSALDIQSIIDKIAQTFGLVTEAEITIEVNPDDITENYVKSINKFSTVNRISIGVQSFIDKHLKFLGRRHNVKQSISAINLFIKYNFYNISIDIIYGLPIMEINDLQYNLEKFISFELPHLSAYHLTIEPNTKFGYYYKIGKLKTLNEEKSIEQFEFLMNFMNEYDYLHYEISNFALKNYLSRHNFAYWIGKKYLGLGPAAHSYDGNFRYWNISNVKKYIKAINDNKLPMEKEKLTRKDKFNEYLLTRLRTYLGIDVEFLQKQFPNFYREIVPTIKQNIQTGNLKESNKKIVLTHKGKFIADNVIADLFV